MKAIITLVIIVLLGIGGYVLFNFHKTKNYVKNNSSNVKIVEENVKNESEIKKEEEHEVVKENIEKEVVNYKKNIDKTTGENTKKINTNQKSLLILDASGSMLGRIGEKMKIDIAKDVIKDIVVDTEDFELGLMIYGHRDSKDCSDIETVVKPQKNNAKNISEEINKILPKGMTPIGNAVIVAANSLEYKKQKASIILISDGVDTCGADLCAVGKKLEQIGVDFTAHVIGFDMTKEQEKGLKCLANETGGVFTSTKNADELKKALKANVEEVESCTRDQIGDITFSIPFNSIEAGKKFEIVWSESSKFNDKIAILPKDSKSLENNLSKISSLYLAKKKGILIAPADVGEYDIVYFAECGAILGRKSFIVENVAISLNISDIVEAGTEIEITWTGPNKYGDDITILPKGSTHWDEHLDYISYLNSEKRKSKVLLQSKEGEYDIVYWSNAEKILARKTFTVVKTKNISDTEAHLINIPVTIPKNTEFEVRWIGPKNNGDIITISPNDSNDWNEYIGRSLYHIQKNDSDISFISPSFPGDYDVVYWFEHEKVLDRKTFRVTD